MKVTAISFILCILLVSSVSAIRINEVEVNPIDGQYGKEWVELYNGGEEINISGWEVWEGIVSGLVNPKKISTIPEGTMLQSGGYFIVEFSNKLNNNGDFVTLYDLSGNKIDETNTLNDSYADARTWQFCVGAWKFLNSTKGQENNCPVEDEITPPENNESQENDSFEGTESEEDDSESQEENSSQNTPELIQDFIPASAETIQDGSEKIVLSPKRSSETAFVSSEGKLRNYILYFFMALVIILCLYLAFKKF